MIEPIAVATRQCRCRLITIQQIADALDIPSGSVLGGVKPTRWKALARQYVEMAREEVSE